MATGDIATNNLPQQPHHLLLVDDDARLRRLLSRYFTRIGHLVTAVGDCAAAREALRYLRFHAAILDINLGGESGLSLGREIFGRKLAPVLYLSARAEAGDRIEGLESGGADYLTKPFEPRELELRLANLIANSPASKGDIAISAIDIGDMRYDMQARKLTDSSGCEIALTKNELLVMHALAISCPRLATRARIAEALRTVSDRAVAMSVTRLRRKLEPAGLDEQYIFTVRGEGFRLNGTPSR